MAAITGSRIAVATAPGTMCDMLTRVAPWGVGLLLFTVSACGGADDATQAPSGGRPQLVMPGTPNDIEVQMPAKPGESFVHGAHPICLDEPGQIDVTSIEFASGDLEITDWAVKPGPSRTARGVPSSSATHAARPSSHWGPSRPNC